MEKISTVHTYEQLEVAMYNHEMTEDILRDRLYLMSGCRNFGGQDGTVGLCVECLYNNPELHGRCRLFQTAVHTYLTAKYAKARKAFLNTIKD